MGGMARWLSWPQLWKHKGGGGAGGRKGAGKEEEGSHDSQKRDSSHDIVVLKLSVSLIKLWIYLFTLTFITWVWSATK